MGENYGGLSGRHNIDETSFSPSFNLEAEVYEVISNTNTRTPTEQSWALGSSAKSSVLTEKATSSSKTTNLVQIVEHYDPQQI